MGDEFLIVCPGAGDATDMLKVAQRVVDAVRVPMIVPGARISLTASVGVAIAHEQDSDLQSLIATADAAMYVAKRRADGVPVVHEHSHATSSGRLTLARVSRGASAPRCPGSGPRQRRAGDGRGAEALADVVERGVERAAGPAVERQHEWADAVVEVGDRDPEQRDALLLDHRPRGVRAARGRSRGSGSVCAVAAAACATA